jgi:DNA-binding HxlR family transcriptional regulator
VKHYGQYCPVAHALEVVGERWSLLIVRDLMGGPKRYTDLASGLPGIGTNILAGRLKDLESVGVLRKYRLPPPGFYYFFVDRDLSRATVTGDRAAVENLLGTLPAVEPVAA